MLESLTRFLNSFISLIWHILCLLSKNFSISFDMKLVHTKFLLWQKIVVFYFMSIVCDMLVWMEASYRKLSYKNSTNQGEQLYIPSELQTAPNLSTSNYCDCLRENLWLPTRQYRACAQRREGNQYNTLSHHVNSLLSLVQTQPLSLPCTQSLILELGA